VSACADYRPPAIQFQQLELGGATGRFDCTAWTGAWLANADSCGTIDITGRAVRLASSEPKPDDWSPGLNFPQVDAAVYRVTSGRVNLTLGGAAEGRPWSPTTSSSKAQQWALNGRPIGVQINRGVLIDYEPDLGAADDFRGGHAIGVKVIKGAPWVFDPLVRIYIPVTWTNLWRAASRLQNAGLSAGRVNILAARDIVPSSYRVKIDGPARFSAYKVTNGVITGIRAASVGSDVTRRCTRRESIWFPAHKSYRNVVRLLEGYLATTDYPYISTDADPVTYVEVLP